MLIFLKELSKILSGAIDGAEAQDPGDPPLSLTITHAEQEKEEQGLADEEVPAEEEEFPAEDPELEL